jgi:hypothetical protein
MTIIDSQVHAYEANTPKRPWHSVPNWPDHVTGDEMVAAMDKVGVDGAIFISAFSMALWAAIEAVQEPPTGRGMPTLPDLDLQPSVHARNARKADWLLKASGIGCFVLAGLVLGFLPTFWPVWLFVAGIATAQLTRKPKTHGAIQRKSETAERTWLQTLQNWESAGNASEFFKSKEALKEVRYELEGLPREEQRRVAELASKRQSEQLRLYLERFQIRHHKISGIGASKLQTLTSYGIETAADVVAPRVMAVPGFGPVNSRPLLDWRAQLERRFRFNANPTRPKKRLKPRLKPTLQGELCTFGTGLRRARDSLPASAPLRFRAAISLTGHWNRRTECECRRWSTCSSSGSPCRRCSCRRQPPLRHPLD